MLNPRPTLWQRPEHYRQNKVQSIAFGGYYETPRPFSHQNRAILAGDPGNLSLVIRQGDLAPGFGDGRTIRFIGSTIDPIISSNERIAFIADDNDGDFNEDGIWGGTFDSISLIAHEGVANSST